MVEAGNYDAAVEWFARVEAPPISEGELWPVIRNQAIRLCEERAEPALAPSRPKPAGLGNDAPPLPSLLVRSLGRFMLARDGIVLAPCRSRKAIALFRYLLTQRFRAASKEAIMDLFWPNAAPSDAAHSLHVAVSALRQYLDPPTRSYVLLEGNCYRLDPDVPLDDDCAHFETLSTAAEHLRRQGALSAARAACEQARALYQGDYCVGHGDSSWALAEQERLRSRYLTVLDLLGQILMAQGEYKAAVDCYETILVKDEFREDAYAQAMRCYAYLGRRGDALRLYDQCTSLLRQELGLTPLPEIQALFHAIITNDIVLAE
jgi:DNA-binding SARP family transcriptional activator